MLSIFNQVFRFCKEQPLNVVKAIVKGTDGALIFKRPLWIGIIGERKDEVSPEMAYNAYLNRYDIEHFSRFGKQKLLLDAYQTPELKHEEYWWKFVYCQSLGKDICQNTKTHYK